MAKLRLPIVLLCSSGLFLGCGEPIPTLRVPDLSAPYYLIGSAGGGRALTPVDMRIVKKSEVEDELELRGSKSVSVDMLVAGITDEVLPRGMGPEDLEIVSVFDDVPQRPLPPLFRPHVLVEPKPPGEPNVLAPVYDLDGEVFEETRETRFFGLTENLAIKDPCRELEWSRDFVTERLPATSVWDTRVMSSGEVFFGLSTTSTAVLGVMGTDRGPVEQFGIDMGDPPLEATEKADVFSVSDDEVTTRDGRAVPAVLAMIRGGVLGHVAKFSPSQNRYIDVTPRELIPSMGKLRRVQRLDIDGRSHVCVTGQVLDNCGGSIAFSAQCDAGTWCEDPDTGEWAAYAQIEGSSSVTGVLQSENLPDLVLAVTGGLYRPTTGADPVVSWREEFFPAVNQSCSACTSFSRLLDAPAGGDLLAVAFGTRAGTLKISGRSLETLELAPITAVRERLFGDERGDEAPLNIDGGTFTGDGALWLTTDRNILLRVAPDLESAERVCLPTSAIDGAIATSLGSTPDGDLIVATTPPRVGVASWRTP